MTYLANSIKNTTLFHAAVGASGSDTTALDTAAFEGPILITVNVRSGGTNAMTTIVTESDTSGGAYTAIDADSLVDPVTGSPDTFASVEAGGLNDTLAVLKHTKRYIRVEFDGGTLTQNAFVVATGEKKYTADS